MAKFDNLDDVIGKFSGTICMYDKHAAIVKQANQLADGAFVLSLQSTVMGRAKSIKLDDPLLQYQDFNLGYANQNGYAHWWYRRPLKQYKQGLKAEQMQSVSSVRDVERGHFGFTSAHCAMLENVYPTLDECHRNLKDGLVRTYAFHRNFGMSWDDMHEDFIIEHKGVRVGVTPDLKRFKLRDEYKYLAEALQEAVG